MQVTASAYEFFRKELELMKRHLNFGTENFRVESGGNSSLRESAHGYKFTWTERELKNSDVQRSFEYEASKELVLIELKVECPT